MTVAGPIQPAETGLSAGFLTFEHICVDDLGGESVWELVRFPILYLMKFSSSAGPLHVPIHIQVNTRARQIGH